MVDLTGGISETIDIKDKSQIPLDIYEILWRSWKMNSFLGCSIPVCRHGFRGSRMMIFPFSILFVYDFVLLYVYSCRRIWRFPPERCGDRTASTWATPTASQRSPWYVTSDEVIYMLDVCRETFYSIYNNAEIATSSTCFAHCLANKPFYCNNMLLKSASNQS